MDVQDDPKVEKVPRLSRRFVNGIDAQTNTQDRRRSIRLKARAANSSMGGETSDGGPLCSAKEGKKETKTKQSEGSTVVKSQEGKESLIDCEVRTTENYGRMKLQDVSKVEKVPRRRRKDINVLMDKRPVKAAKREKSFSELLVDGQAQKGAKQPNRTFGNDRADKKLPPSSKHTALDNMSNSLKSCSVMDCERDGASVGNVKKPNVNDETQIRVRFSRNSSRQDSFKAPILVEGNLVDKKMDETLKKKQDRSAEPGMDIETKSTQSNLTQIELLDQYPQFEQEAAGSTNVAYGGSSRKSKTMNRECVKDMPQGMIENSPSSTGTKAAESVMVIENVLDSTREKSVDSFQRTNTQELNSELMERKREEKLEHDTILMPVIEECKEEVLLIERLSPALVPLAISNPEAELVVPTSHTLVKDIASTVIVEENTKTKEEISICGSTSELKEHSSVAKLANIEEILENSAECWKEINPSKDDEKGSLENKVQAANLHGHVFEYNTENNSGEEEMEITKNGYLSVGPFVNLTPEKLLDEYSQLKPEEAGGPNVEARSSSMKMKTGTQELVKDKPQGMAEKDSPSTSETKATEPVMISENVLDSTLKSSVDITPVRSTQELDSELLEGEREEKHEQDTVLMAASKEKDGASSLSVFLIERSEVSNPEVELFVETTPPLASAQLAVSNHEVELGAPTTHILVKDIASTIMANEDIKTKEEILISIPISELKEHSFVAKLAEADAILENSAECWNEINSSKDDEKGSLEKKIQAENLHGNFSEYSTDNSKVGCISVGHSGNLESLDEVKDVSLEKTEQTISCESGCKLNELELRRWSSTDFTSLSPKEDNVSKCFEEDEIKALSQPLPRNKDASAFDESAIFTTPERNLMLMEQLIENGKTPAADSVTHQKDEAVESHVVVFTTPRIDEAGKEENDTATNFPDESDAPNTTERYEGSRQTEARNEAESKVIELHDETEIATSLVRKFSVEDFKGDNMTTNSHVVPDVFIASESQSHMGEFEPDEAEKTNRENMNVDLLGESNTYNNPESPLLFGDSGVDETKKRKDHTAATCEESFVLTSPERQQILVNSEPHSDGKGERNEVEFKDESAFFSRLESGLVLGESGQAGLDIGKSYLSQYQSHHSFSPKFDFRENTIADSSGSMASKVSYNHEFNVGQETAGAELMKKSSQAEDVNSLDATQGKSKKNSEHSPHVDSVNLFDFDIEEAETIMEAERNVACSSYVLALPIEGNSGTVGEISSYLEVAGTCSMVSEESGPSTDVQNQMHDALEELATTDNNEADEHKEAKITKNNQKDNEGNLLLNSSGVSFDSEVDFRNTCEKIDPKFLEDEAADSIATAVGKSISLASDELTVQNNINEKAADEEMIRRETTPSPEETLHDSSKNKEYLNIDESDTSSEKQVRREPILIYRTQVKLKRHDMKENAPNSKIVDNLNVTAPRTSKRQPLKDLRNN